MIGLCTIRSEPSECVVVHVFLLLLVQLIYQHRQSLDALWCKPRCTKRFQLLTHVMAFIAINIIVLVRIMVILHDYPAQQRRQQQ